MSTTRQASEFRTLPQEETVRPTIISAVFNPDVQRSVMWTGVIAKSTQEMCWARISRYLRRNLAYASFR